MTIYHNYKEYIAAYNSGERNIKFISTIEHPVLDRAGVLPGAELVDGLRDGSLS